MPETDLTPCPLCATPIKPGLYRCPQCTGELNPVGKPTRSSGLSAGGVFAAVLGALVVVIVAVFVINYLASANDDLECATESADRVMDGRPALDCDEP